MRCDKAREILMTDFIDGQIDNGLKKEVELHLKTCQGCREAADSMRDVLTRPFSSIKKEKVPGHLWDGIRGNIEKPVRTVSYDSSKAWSFIRRIPGPVYAVFAVIVLIVVGLRLNAGIDRRNVNEYLYSQAEYMYSLDESNGSFETANMDIGTDIEYFFL